MLKFRDPRADEIECRVATASEKGVSLLVYKDARVDQNILDETVGPMNWQKFYSRDNANCTVQIWDDEKKQWISKEDTGTESNTEKEKGLASDSFKRACFNWGIGRCLYTAPFIWINAGDCKIVDRNGKKTCYDKFVVDTLVIRNGKIVGLRIYNASLKKYVFEMKGTDEASDRQADEEASAHVTDPNETFITKADWMALQNICKRKGVDVVALCKQHNISKPSEISFGLWNRMMRDLDSMEG